MLVDNRCFRVDLFCGSFEVPAAARAGAIAPCDVTVPAQNTGLGPEKTSFFQALGITTKISRGTIEILASVFILFFLIWWLGWEYLVLKPSVVPLQSDVGLIKIGDKVGASEATLLNMLNISPFSYGLIIQQVYDNGSVYSPEVLDITEASLHARFLEVRFNNARHNSLTFFVCDAHNVRLVT